MTSHEDLFDVIIVGGGPVGLVIAYSLARMGVKTCVLERHDKAQQAMYGRATTLYPRTLEIFDQLDLMNDLNQLGFVSRNSVTFRDGKRVTTRGWHAMFTSMHETYLSYLLNIRQKYSEEVILKAYAKMGGQVRVGWLLKEMAVAEDTGDGYKVGIIVEDLNTKETQKIKSKYIVGADGGQSTVRQLAGISFEGDDTNIKWVRIDAVVKTNMPDAMLGLASIESKSHGNVLWVALDHGRTRVGYALTESIAAKYGPHLTEQQALHEAIEAMKPFSLEFVTVDWWTVYGVKQKLADRYSSRNCIFLAGDACHTHSSGAAQGMNTGIHDAVNLGWKLGGVVRGWYDPKILHTYEMERRPAAETLLRLDKTFSALITGSVPIDHTTPRPEADADSNDLLYKAFNDSIQFNIGLGITFKPNMLNITPSTGMVTAGSRGPDALIRAPGSPLPIRLFEITKNTGCFWILVFAGQPRQTERRLHTVREYLNSDESFTKFTHPDMIRFLTVVSGTENQGDLTMGVPTFGNAYHDVENTAHARYSISTDVGAIVILRPDGVLGFATNLSTVKDVGRYMQQIVGPRKV